MDILWFLIIGFVAGWLADMLVKGTSFGLVGHIVVGVVGAVIGGFLFGLFGVESYGTLGNIVMATVGAIVLLALLSMVNRGATR
jgi:uncharacterized membrane protein YeaQ/YmgE (transglycosylase-associated protein family)